MSVIHLAGLGGQAFRSSAAPPTPVQVSISDHTMSLVWQHTFDERMEVIMFDSSL